MYVQKYVNINCLEVWEMSTITEDVYPLEKHDNQVEKVLPAEEQGTVFLQAFLLRDPLKER